MPNQPVVCENKPGSVSTGASLCVGQPFTRLTGVINIGPEGSAMHQVDFSQPAIANMFFPGAALTFQFVHRDLFFLNDQATINASDAIGVLFE